MLVPSIHISDSLATPVHRVIRLRVPRLEKHAAFILARYDSSPYLDGLIRELHIGFSNVERVGQLLQVLNSLSNSPRKNASICFVSILCLVSKLQPFLHASARCRNSKCAVKQQ